MKKCLLAVLTMFACLIMNANHWEPDPYQFENNMISIGIIKFDGVEQRSENLEIGAFCGDDCRGSAMATYNGSFDRYFVFLMIYGDENDGITFRVYDHEQGLELEMESLNSMVFHVNGQEGTATEPFEFAFQSPEPNTYEIIVEANPENGGTVNGSGTYNEGEMCTISATPNVGYAFVNFTENGNVVSTESSYSFQVTENHSFIANFELNQYEVTAMANPEGSAVISGGGVFDHGATCTLTVSPNVHWFFDNWTVDGDVVSTETEYSFTVTENVEVVANLYFFDGLEENDADGFEIYPNPAKDVIFVEFGDKSCDIVITNCLGQVVKTVAAENGATKINISDLTSGIYFVVINNRVKKIVKD